MTENKPKEFRIYRANKNNNGCASAWQLSYKKDNKFDNWLFFMTIAPQTGVNENGDASFDWKEKSITVKLGENDIGEIMATLEGRQDQVGYKGSLFHQTPNGGNKTIALQRGDNGFSLKVSAQDKEKKLIGPYYHGISNAEASILLTLLKRAIERIYGF